MYASIPLVQGPANCIWLVFFFCLLYLVAKTLLVTIVGDVLGQWKR